VRLSMEISHSTVNISCDKPINPESWLFYDWRFTVNQFVLATGSLRPTTSNFILQLNTCGYSSYVTSSLTRGWVCRLKLLLSSPAQSYSGPSPAGLMTTFYCLRYPFFFSCIYVLIAMFTSVLVDAVPGVPKRSPPPLYKLKIKKKYAFKYPNKAHNS
jgi:hypothetical protein